MGEKITITKHGVAVATLQPPGSGRTDSIGDTIGELRKFRRLDGLNDADQVGGIGKVALVHEEADVNILCQAILFNDNYNCRAQSTLFAGRTIGNSQQVKEVVEQLQRRRWRIIGRRT